MKVLDSQQMQACDRAAIDEHGIAELVLMENAGTQVVEAMREYFAGDSPERVAVLCGKGNNGGDGLVVARQLHEAGCRVSAYLFAAPGDLEGSVAENYDRAQAVGVEIVEVADVVAWRRHVDELPAADCIIDALFGTGIRGALRGYVADVVEEVNELGVPIVAVDLPSGLSADDGEIAGPAIDADLTVTFAAPKWCHTFPPACELCGDLAVVDIGIPAAPIAAAASSLELITPDDLAGLLGPREPDSHKGTYGRVLIVAGSTGTAGAAVLAARAALRGGAGLVTVAPPDSVYAPVAAQLTEALVRPQASGAGGGYGRAALDALAELAAASDALAVGPGVGTAAETVEVIRALVAGATVPLVIDADGLNAFAGAVELLAAVAPPCILTPHPGEMARLLGSSTAQVQADRVGAARALAGKSGAIVVLKGYRSLICVPDGSIAVNPTGNPGMASGGTGDVLTGLIAALLGQGLEAGEAARAAVFVHGEAGDLGVAEVGEASLVASDLIEWLPVAMLGLGDQG